MVRIVSTRGLSDFQDTYYDPQVDGVVYSDREGAFGEENRELEPLPIPPAVRVDQGRSIMEKK